MGHSFYITYCVMDTEAGANPFGHACLIFSKQAFEKGPIEVVNCFGHYSLPSSTTNPLIRAAKRIAGFSIDLQDGHGVLRKESMRYLDENGLKGISFAVSEEVFQNTITSCEQSIADEEQAIKELDTELDKLGMKKNAYTRYILERAKAAEENRAPRLKKFHVTMDLTKHGPDTSHSYTCKDRALDILQDNGVFSSEVRGILASTRAKQAFPRYSRFSLAPIRLVSTGDLLTHRSARTGKLYCYSEWEKNQLYWATPIAIMDSKPSFTPNFNAIKEIHRILKTLLNRVRQMEAAIINKIDELEKKSGHQQERLLFKDQLRRLRLIALEFNNGFQNSNFECLLAKRLKAETILNVATLCLNPDKVKYSFVFRAIKSAYLFHMLLGLLLLAATIALLPIAPSVAVASTAALVYTGRSMHGFYKEEVKFAEMKSDYNQYMQNQTVSHSRDEVSSPTEPAYA
ncbi:hypothetical protein [Legionella yabuuchiae]|uniref:hypothetical protein n=1 Tax=Legionella yabuuchiae TaxID=376727 RepID=UPI0010561D84|nr:hypothetical protein [Legionella yabuuchiae]